VIFGFKVTHFPPHYTTFPHKFNKSGIIFNLRQAERKLTPSQRGGFSRLPEGEEERTASIDVLTTFYRHNVKITLLQSRKNRLFAAKKNFRPKTRFSRLFRIHL